MVLNLASNGVVASVVAVVCIPYHDASQSAKAPNKSTKEYETYTMPLVRLVRAPWGSRLYF